VIVAGGASDTGGDVSVFNFPNPFDLQSKTLTLTHPGTQSSITTSGTVIRYTVPAAKVGPASIRIYDIAGKKVRTLDLGVPAGDTVEYVAWDGANDAGRRVASGVYIGVLDVGGAKTFWKLAVIK
jgi:flagellar hook assembly protein FlgD